MKTYLLLIKQFQMYILLETYRLFSASGHTRFFYFKCSYFCVQISTLRVQLTVHFSSKAYVIQGMHILSLFLSLSLSPHVYAQFVCVCAHVYVQCCSCWWWWWWCVCVCVCNLEKKARPRLLAVIASLPHLYQSLHELVEIVSLLICWV